MSSLHMLAIKTKTFRDLIDESPFKKSDVVTIQVILVTPILPQFCANIVVRPGSCVAALSRTQRISVPGISILSIMSSRTSESTVRLTGSDQIVCQEGLPNALLMPSQTRTARMILYKGSMSTQQEALGKCFV